MRARTIVKRPVLVSRDDFQKGFFYRPHTNNQHWRGEDMLIWLSPKEEKDLGILDNQLMCMSGNWLYKSSLEYPWMFYKDKFIQLPSKTTVSTTRFDANSFCGISTVGKRYTLTQ